MFMTQRHPRNHTSITCSTVTVIKSSLEQFVYLLVVQIVKSWIER